MSRRLRSLLTLSTLTTLFAATTITGEAAATDAAPIALGEISQPAPSAGLDADVLRATAKDEIQLIDASKLPSRRVVVSLALIRSASNSEDLVVCTVNAMLRDARTGAMIAFIEAGAHAEGPVSHELRKQVANAAVRSAVRRIPHALGGKK
jgi:hypothetical protein